MRTLLIGYDLNRPGQDYADIINYLKTMPTWWHHLDSTWLVRTTITSVEMRDKLRQYIDDHDEVLVLDVTGDAWATIGIGADGVQWLRNNL